MRHLPPLEVMQRAVRKEVCTDCHLRQPAEGDWPNLAEPRPCESKCTIFLNLPSLRTIAGNIDNSYADPYEKAITNMVCQNCNQSPTHGDFCAEWDTRQCPLSRYNTKVIDVLERVTRAVEKSAE